MKQKTPPTKADLAAVIAVSSTFLREVVDALKMRELPQQQQQLLLQLYIHGQISQAELENYTGVAKSANSRNIAKLGEGERPLIKRGPGLIESFEDPADRRVKSVRLTPLGRELLEKAARKAAQHLPNRDP